MWSNDLSHLPGDSATARAPVENDPAIVRAMGLHAIGRTPWATAEFNEAMARLGESQRPIAVQIAQEGPIREELSAKERGQLIALLARSYAALARNR